MVVHLVQGDRCQAACCSCHCCCSAANHSSKLSAQYRNLLEDCPLADSDSVPRVGVLILETIFEGQSLADRLVAADAVEVDAVGGGLKGVTVLALGEPSEVKGEVG